MPICCNTFYTIFRNTGMFTFGAVPGPTFYSFVDWMKYSDEHVKILSIFCAYFRNTKLPLQKKGLRVKPKLY